MQDFCTLNKTFEYHIRMQHSSTNELTHFTSQRLAACFNNEILTGCMLVFAWSRRCDKSINEYTYHMDRQHIVHTFHKPMGSCIDTIYQHENESFLQWIFQLQITLQQQSVQTHAKWIYFHRFFKEGQRRCQNPLIWYNIGLRVCLYIIFFRNKRGLLKTQFFVESITAEAVPHSPLCSNMIPNLISLQVSSCLRTCLCCFSVFYYRAQ